MTHSDSILQFEATLETLRLLTDKMKGASSIHQIDIDLLQQKTREIYEQILMLEPASFQPVKAKETLPPPEPDPENIILHPPVDENISEIEAKPEVEPEVEAETEQEEIVSEIFEVSEPEPDEIGEEVFEDIVMERVSGENRQEMSAQLQPKTTLDLFSESHDESLGAVLNQRSNHTDLGERLKNSPVGDLREAIGINDKFQFVNELFNGDLGQYNKVLDELNNFTSLQGVLTYLSELSVQYDFQKSGVAFQNLKSLLDTKYA